MPKLPSARLVTNPKFKIPKGGKLGGGKLGKLKMPKAPKQGDYKNLGL